MELDDIMERLISCGFEKNKTEEDEMVFPESNKVVVSFKHGIYGPTVEVSGFDGSGFTNYVSFPIFSIELFSVKKYGDTIVLYIV